jgi:diguanylate cyclase (GGDEF)-like protein
VMPGQSRIEAQLRAADICAAVRAAPIITAVGAVALTVSIGVSTTKPAQQPHSTIDDLLRAADVCLYASKRAGRDRVTA